MKGKLLAVLALSLAALFGSATDSKAQATGISIDSFGVYSASYCALPAFAWSNFAGYATGPLTSSDMVTLYINYGDGTDTSWTQSLFANQGWFWANTNHTYTTPGAYTVMYAATTSAGPADTAYANTVAFSNTCANLSGNLYVDADNDCTMDAGETPIIWSVVEIAGGGATYYTTTDINGHYAIDLPDGVTYTITPNTTWSNVTATCPATGSATVALTTASVNNFAYSCNSSAIDYAVGGWASNWRPGHTRPMTIYVQGNNWCGSLPVTLTATLPSQLSYSSTATWSTAPTSVAGNVLTWNIPTSVAAYTSFYTTIMVECDSFATMGDTLCVALAITVADANAANNTANVCAEVNNSYDPNDKSVSPRGTTENGNIVNGTRLTYLVNFQNTGNDVAYDVTVKDKIDVDLDLSTLQVMETSHPMQMSITDREISFFFENINLPDSGANEPASHGYIIYSISPEANLPIGRVINNTADIYFDFNDPIITNTTKNTIISPQSVQTLTNGSIEALIFPNPANNTINVEVKDKGEFNAALYDMMGRIVSTVKVNNGKAAISVSNVPSGMYFVRISGNSKQELSTKISILH